MVVTTARATAHTIAAGEDIHGLGRWNFVTLRGRENHMTTIISVYRPQEMQTTTQRQLVASIPRRESVVAAKDAVELWFRDLHDLVSNKIQQGHSILIGGDFNDNLNDKESRVCKFMSALGLREVIIEKYGSGPATHKRGKTTIDGLFATHDIDIINGQYIPFHKSPSDHRWIAVDIDERALVRRSRNDKTPPVLRRATSKIPSVRHRFQELLERKITAWALGEKMDTLYKQCESNKAMDQEMINLYESIETKMQRAVKFADRRCRHVRRRKVPFSPLLKRMMGQVVILKQILLREELKGKINRPRTRRIQRLIKKYNYSGQTQFSTIKEVKKHLKLAEVEYKMFKLNAKEERHSYLLRMADEFHWEDKKGKKFHYKRLLRIEQQKEHFRILKRKEGKDRKSGVECVAYSDGEQEQISYSKDVIEEKIIQANQAKLQQANDTILRTERFKKIFGEQGKFAKWEQILRRQITVPDDANEELKMWFSFMTNYDTVEHVFRWTTEEYIQSWKGMDENKTTTQGIQVAHIKCLDPSSQAADIVSKLALIPLMKGYAPQHWKIGIDSMIPKKEANLRPEKLRLILLMDARFNHNNKLIGKKMMEFGEKHKRLADEQFGSRKEKSATDHALNKRLNFDIIRQQRLQAAYVANDAKSCYDRILLMVAYLTMRNFGIPASVAKSSISCILYMQHYIKTAYGISTKYYGGEQWGTLPHGCGQGNGYGPALWACISSPLLMLLKNKHHGSKLSSYLSNTKVHLSGIAFVDDTDLIETDSMSPDKNVITSAQTSLDQWNTMLSITGGALEPAKTFWCPIGMNIDAQDHELTVDSNGRREIISQRKENESFFSLGVWQSPTGKEDRQVEYLQNLIEKWTFATNKQYISRYHARTAVAVTIGRSILYPLPATGLSAKECKRIQTKVNQSVLGKMGVVRTVSTVLANTPTQYGGYGVPDIVIEQVMQHVAILQQHMHGHTVTARLLRISFDQYTLEAGRGGCPLDTSYSTYTTPRTWVSNTLEFLHFYGILIKGDLTKLEQWTENDTFIMDVMVQRGMAHLSIINKVRLYLRVATKADLISACGRHYDRNLIHGIRSASHPSPSRFRYEWATMEEPTNYERAIWSTALRTAFDIGTNGRVIDFTESLQWNQQARVYSQWNYSNSSKCIYQRMKDHKWLQWVRTTDEPTRKMRNDCYIPDIICSTLPNDCQPCSVQQRGVPVTQVIIISCASPRQCVLLEGTTLLQESWILRNSRTSTAGCARYLGSISERQGIAFSDGSKSETNVVTFSFLLGYNTPSKSLGEVDLHQYIHGFDVVPGNDIDSSSYRGELAGILAIIIQTNLLCLEHSITTGQCTIWCDNRGAGTAAFGFKRPTPKWKCYDLVSMIHYHRAQSRIQWDWSHVRSHQDQACPFSQLTLQAQGNVIADMLATRAHGREERWGNQLLPGEPWRIVLGGRPCGGNLTQQLREYLYKPRAQTQWAKIFGISDTIVEQCNWDNFFRLWESKSRDQRIWWTKFLSRAHATGENLLRRNHSGTNKCPCCGEAEDAYHLIQCQHDDIHQAIASFQNKFNQQMDGLLDIEIVEGIKSVLAGFRCGFIIYHPRWDKPFFEFLTQQFRIGQGAFFAGLWLRTWDRYCMSYSNHRGIRRQPGKSLEKAAKAVQTLIFQLWAIRNKILHGGKQNIVNMEIDKQTDIRVDTVFRKRPPLQCMTKGDASYFKKYDAATVKKMKLDKKLRWVEGAEAILEYFIKTQSSQAASLRSFFHWDPG